MPHILPPPTQKTGQTPSRRGPMKLRNKLFSAYLLLATIVLILFALFFYLYVSHILIGNEETALTALNSSFAEQVDAAVENLDNISVNINYSNLMREKLNAFYDLDLKETGIKELASLFVTINGINLRADQINLFDMQGNAVKVGIITKTDQVDVSSLSWMEKARELNGLKLVGEPCRTNAYSPAGSSSDWFLSVYRTYSNQHGKRVGYIETIKRCRSLFQPVISYKKRTENPAAVYIFNSEGHLVYPYDLPASEKQALSFYYQVLPSLGKDTLVRNPSHGYKERLSFTRSSYSGWTYICVQKESLILAPINRLLLILFVFIAVMLSVSVLISYRLSGSMVKPIKHLKHVIQRLNIDNLGAERVDDYNTFYEELGELYLEFQTMSEKLDLSMKELLKSREQELKSRTLALQSQTNPHFYYNTLSCISILAENGQTGEVMTLCRTLSQIMRYITGSSSVPVTLEEEIEYVKKYLYCMKIRYQSSLICEVDVDPSLLSLPVPKLIIQPIVENAIKYGTDCLPPWTITVRGHKVGDGWQIDVIDSGNGFTPEALRMIRERMEEADRNPGMPDMKIHGLGMVNVYLRWKIYSRENTVFSFGNTKEGHAIVTIGQSRLQKEETDGGTGNEKECRKPAEKREGKAGGKRDEI